MVKNDSLAVILIKGSQYLVKEGDEIIVDRMKLDEKPEAEVLLFSDGKEVLVGTPSLEKIKVTFERGEDFKGEKLRVFKYKSKSRYKKTRGYRHSHTKLVVKAIKA